MLFAPSKSMKSEFSEKQKRFRSQFKALREDKF